MTAPISVQHGHQPTLRERRLMRLRREIALLEHMDGSLWRKALICAALALPILTGVMALAAAKLHWFGYHPLAVIAVCALVATAAWWGARYSLFIPLILLMLIAAVLTESAPDFSIGSADGSDGDSSDTRSRRSRHGRDKAGRRAKVASALARRRAILAKLEAQP